MKLRSKNTTENALSDKEAAKSSERERESSLEKRTNQEKCKCTTQFTNSNQHSSPIESVKSVVMKNATNRN